MTQPVTIATGKPELNFSIADKQPLNLVLQGPEVTSRTIEPSYMNVLDVKPSLAPSTWSPDRD